MPNILQLPYKTSHQKARLAAYFLLLALVLRSFIPIGYMPASNTAASGFMTLTICNPEHGFYTIQVPIDAPNPTDAKTTFANECPYGLLAQQFFIGPPPILDPVIIRQAVARPFSFKHSHSQALSIRGPPLGSRAPPSVLS